VRRWHKEVWWGLDQRHYGTLMSRAVTELTALWWGESSVSGWVGAWWETPGW
jgi:hypothetical protein